MSKVLKFPDGFHWGASTSAYQVEGGIANNDWALAAKSGRIMPAGSACDHYNRYEEDFDLAKSLGHNCHRFSIEWSRIEPEEGVFDHKEIEHYRKVLKALQVRGMTPFVTLWHFTLPHWLSETGGVKNKEFPAYFSRYCVHIVKELQNECVHWSTINEPVVFSTMGYLWGQWPPFDIFKINTFFKVFRNLVKAHNMAYTEIKRIASKARIGIIKNNMYMHVSRFSRFNPINHIASVVNNFLWNKVFLNRIKFHLDNIGLNYYFHTEFGKKEKYMKSDMGWDLYPTGMYHVLKDLKKYKVPIYIAESGLADEDDNHRAEYIKDLVLNTHKAIEDGVDVRGFMYWSLIDNYEWIYGYSKKFGLISFDMKTKERTVRESAYEYKKICENNTLII
jgi:beta-glucosidase